MPKLKDLQDRVDDYVLCLRRRGMDSFVDEFQDGLSSYDSWRKLTHKIGELRAEANKLSKLYGKNQDESLLDKSRDIRKEIASTEQEAAALESLINSIELRLPNWLSSDAGSVDEVIEYRCPARVYSSDLPQFLVDHGNATPIEVTTKRFSHYDLVGTLVDQETAGKVAQSRFYYELDELVLLDMALSMYAIEFFRERGYGGRLMITPYMLRKEVESRICYFEAFKDTIFEVEKDGLVLLPSSEHSIVAFYLDKIFKEGELPLRILAWSPCFRREAGAHGKETRGIFRVRQFHKAEIHAIVEKGEDAAELEKMRQDIQDFLESMNLPNRSIIVSAPDMDKRAVKQIDIETWMPAQGKFAETHSIATLGTWVSEKGAIRYKDGKRNVPATNLYATAVAVQRMICAVCENCFDPTDSVIIVPEVLRKYMMGVDTISVSSNLPQS